ncbi:putative two-component membrane permease complex subunit [Flavobacteriaceae bacterium UJ101]|nr:putative two-component membrane permease complex subunit [Flavobacteriaceae bacterium UJ101]
MDFIIDYIYEFWSLTKEMAPWLLLGFLIAGVLKVYFPAQKIDQHLGKNNLKSVLKAAFLGVPMPLCSCGVIPTGVGFYKSGASAGATNSFMISTPQTGVDSILATQALMGWPLAIMRPFIAFVTGIFGGVLTNLFKLENPNKLVEQEIKTECSDGCCSTEEKKQEKNKLKVALHFAFIEMVQDIGKWLLIGLALAALISVLVPDSFFENYIGSGVLELLIVLVASIPLYVCATGSIPLVSSLILKGISPGAAIVFLMAGPATNMATLAVIKKAIGTKFMWIYLSSIVIGALFFGFLINLVIPHDFLIPYVSKASEHSMSGTILTTILGVILLGLIFYALFLDRYFNKKEVIIMKNTLKVEGMMCNHCKNNVETNVSKQEGVTQTQVNLETKEVQIEGNVDIQHIKKVINNLGYKVIEK